MHPCNSAHTIYPESVKLWLHTEPEMVPVCCGFYLCVMIIFFFFDGLIVFLLVLCCLLSVWLGLTSGLSWSQECLNWNEEQEGGTGVAPRPLGLRLGLGMLFRTV